VSLRHFLSVHPDRRTSSCRTRTPAADGVRADRRAQRDPLCARPRESASSVGQRRLRCHVTSLAQLRARDDRCGTPGRLARFPRRRRIRGRSQTRITVRARTTEATGSPCPALAKRRLRRHQCQEQKRPRFNRRLNIGGFTCNLARTGPTFESCGDADNMKGSGLASSRSQIMRAVHILNPGFVQLVASCEKARSEPSIGPWRTCRDSDHHETF